MLTLYILARSDQYSGGGIHRHFDWRSRRLGFRAGVLRPHVAARGHRRPVWPSPAVNRRQDEEEQRIKQTNGHCRVLLANGGWGCSLCLRIWNVA